MITYFFRRGEQYDSFTGETELKEVTTVYVHEVEEVLHLETTEGDIDTTTNHPFYVINKGWVAAGDLKSGDEVYNLDGSTAVVIDSELEKLDEPVLVYNLEVEDFHTYFVGYEPVLVHNTCGNVYGSGHAGQKHKDTIDSAMSDFANYGYGTSGAGGDYDAIFVNRSLSTAGLNGRQQPDIITVRTQDGITYYDIYEFASPSQYTGSKEFDNLVNKIGTMKSMNPNTEGSVITFFLFEGGKY